jgi:uncharacterized protein YfaS (alpha-2-macroglobulin family)
MKLTKTFSLIIALAINILTVQAQNNNDNTADWKKVESFDKKGLPKSALEQVMKIFDAAVKENNQAQQIKAAMYQMKYRNMVQEDNKENNIFYVDTLIEKTKAPAKNILQSMQAELFESYRNANRYKFYDRTALTEEKSHDITTWSITKLNTTIAMLYKASLQNDVLLKNASLKGLDAIITKGENAETLRPTLYDFLANRALDYFMNDENDVTEPSYKFILNDEKIFAPANDFIKAKFTTKDTASLYFNAILLFQDILKFHLNDKNKDALIDADLSRLAFVNEHGIFTDKSKLYESALENMESMYSSNPLSTQATFLKAQLYFQQGQNYNALTRNENQYDVKKAVEFCEVAIHKYPNSVGALNAKNLLIQINQPSINLTTEKINIPNQPFRTLVQYKNVNTLYLRIIKTSRDEIKRINNLGYNEKWPALLKLKAAKTWSETLPNLKDYNEHAAEIKIDALPIGTYIILASIKPAFSLKDNYIASQTTYISNISYINNNNDEFYVLNRDNGQPLANATLQLWQQKYNYATRIYNDIKKEKYKTDQNGYIKIKKIKGENYNNYLQFNFKDDELFTDDTYYSYYYNSYDNNVSKRTFLFTDRSIYRPGQTVFFKGIVVSTNNDNKKSNIIPNYSTSIILYDVNQQKVATVKVTTNEYGSYNGSFKLPENGLTGQFHLQDSTTQSSQYFSMEEYKRPKFMVEIKKPEGTYRVNDSIKVSGNAKAYAGNNIDGAKVAYRVVRKIQYPVWYGWGSSYWKPYNSGSQMEITNGETTTDASGNFYITFKAIPDETIDKKDQPTFYYEVSTDITDINGETRSGNTAVAVAYQALQLDIITANKLAADSLKNLKISSTNINGIFEKATVTLSIFKLNAPDKIFRNRYWQMPDQFIMSKEHYYKNFPYDVYADEDEVSKWAIEAKRIEISDTTKVNGQWQMVNDKPLVAGWYKLIATTKDKYGEAVKSEKFIQITDSKQQTTTDPIFVDVKKSILEPGEKINYSISTGFEKIWLIHALSKMDKSVNNTYQTITPAKTFSNEIAVTEADRGGISMSYAFVQHNRVYSGNQLFSVPWTNKDLNISYETFRDKILPGSEEKWSLKISGSKSEKVAAEALISMYDASLDQFKPQRWSSLRSLFPNFSNTISFTSNTFTSVNSEERNNIENDYANIPQKSYDALVSNGWNDGYYGRVLYELQGKASGVQIRGYAFENAKMAAPAPPSVNQVKFSPPKIVKDEDVNGDGALDTMTFDMKTGNVITENNTNNTAIQIRTNFNETAFFFPDLKTDADGNISFSFTIPEALTQWKLMTLAHTKELQSGYTEKTVITQKPLMVQPNVPRFLREGDAIEFSAKIVNLSDSQINGTSQLELFDATTNKAVDGWFKNFTPTQNFTIAAGQSAAVSFPITIPTGFNSALTYRIKAISKDGAFSDGEEAALPVLINRTLVTETLPLNMRNTNTKNFKFDKLLNSASSGSLTNHALTVEYTSNPAWYAVQALPYLMEYPYECAEQSFNRYYANTLASFISNSTPKIKAVFEKWQAPSPSEKAGDEATALMSNLQKNEELKSALLQETPWVLDAQNEAQQKKNIAILFDMVRLSKEKDNTLTKLKEMQSSNGGFAWFKGGPDDRYITQYIITGIGHLRKLNALTTDDYNKLKPIVDKALPYLDARLKDEYDYLIKYKVKLNQNNLSTTAIQYLYMRSFFTETAVSSNAKTAYNYYREQSQKYWLSNSKYMQAMIALALNRTGDKKTPLDIIKSLKENAIYKEEMGMYWKEFTTGGYYWYQAPIESQAMMVEAFTDIDKNNTTIDDLKTWLLKQKQTQNWKTTKATSEACYALLLNGSNWLAEEKEVTIKLGNLTISSADNISASPSPSERDGVMPEAGTGYFKKTIEGAKVQQGMGNITVTINKSPNQPISQSTSWGAVYWQYFEDLDKITAAETPLKLVKKLFIEKNSDNGPILTAIKDGQAINIGDKIKVRIELRVDRDMEYIHMKDLRAACMEPTNVISQYKWQGGLGYYESTKDASTNFFFNWLPKGTYVFEYPMFVTHAGNFSNGITTIQCMYAPEFTSHSEGIRVKVAEK